MTMASQANKDYNTRASSLVKLGIPGGGPGNNGIDQVSYTGSGLPGLDCSGSLTFKASREEYSLDVRAGGCKGNLDALRAAWGDFIDTLGRDLGGWDWFMTATLRSPSNPNYPNWTKPGWKYAHRALRDWNDALLSSRFGVSSPYWLAVMEYQHWRGVPHWHVLVGNTGVGTGAEERRMDWVDWWYERFGIARILPYQESLGAKYYLGKYLTKDMADVIASPQLTLSHRQLCRKA